MAELLVRVVDKRNLNDPYKDAQLTKRGDVIVVCPDGWAWSVKEQTNPEWRIVKLPQMTVSEASVYLAPEMNTDPHNPSRVLQARAFSLDVDRLNPAPDRMSAVAVQALKVTKSKRIDPAVIG